MIKSFIPRSIKLSLRLSINLIQDIISGRWGLLAKKGGVKITYPNKKHLTQNLKPNDAKVHNLKNAIQSIESVQIMPNEIFSFWRIVGAPSKKNNFKESRSIIKGKIENSVGGGLCQLSGLIYYVSLQGNLKILERHNHTMDIYNSETRFTPLGSDATVVYGHKDLRIQNNLDHPINFTFLLDKDEITIELNHFDKLEKPNVEFKQTHNSAVDIEIETLVDGVVVTKSTYKKPK